MRRALGLAVGVLLALGATAGLGAAAVPQSAGAAVALTDSAGAAPSASAAGSGVDAPRAALTAALQAGDSSGDTTLNATGEAAIDDVRRCIATTKQLNVFYLIDASGSLFREVDAENATDPDFVRADILGNSLRQLAGLGNGMQVDYSAGFFGSRYESATGWSAVTPETADTAAESLAQSIRNQPSLGYTDWGAGIQAAQDALQTQHAANNGCQMMVWLTDGALNIRDDSAQNAAAINTLCGNAIDGASQPADGLGAFNELRKNGVVVVGVLLSVHPDSRDAAETEYMRPLVESSGGVQGTTVTCGQSPPPSSSVNGALVEANDPSQLAVVFAKLSVLINGGYPHPFDADGGFQVDPGVASFTVITSDGSWQLTPPEGSGLGAISSASLSTAADPAVSLTTTGGAIQVDVDVSGVAYEGRWMLATPGGGDRQLYYYSGLTIAPVAGNQLVAGLAGTVSGSVTTTTGRAVNVGDYSSLTVSVSKLPADGSAAQMIGDAAVAADGGFGLAYTPGADDGGAVDLVYSIDPLTTALNGIELAAVSASQQVVVTIPANYPSVAPSAVTLGTLAGAKGSASGSLTLTAPAEGSAGSVCFPSGSTPTVVSDPANRADTWRWTSSATLSDGCVTLAPGQSVTVDLTATNSVAANSSVAATLPVELTSAAGESLPQTVSVTFDTTRPVNAAAFNVAVLLLVLLGLLIAFGLLWLMNFVTSGLAHGRQLLRASFPVTIDPENGVVGARGVDLMTATLDDFRYQAPLETVKAHSDPELGVLRTHAGLFHVRYEVTAPSGMRVFTVFAGSGAAGSGAAGRRGGSRRRREIEAGRVAPVSDQLNRLWAVVVRENDLVAGGPGAPIVGRLIVYKRNESNRADQFVDRMLDVTRDRTLWGRVARARVLLLEERGGATGAAGGGARVAGRADGAAGGGRGGADGRVRGSAVADAGGAGGGVPSGVAGGSPSATGERAGAVAAGVPRQGSSAPSAVGPESSMPPPPPPRASGVREAGPPSARPRRSSTDPPPPRR